MSTFKISVLVALAALTVPASTPAEGSTLVEILDSTGAVIASQDSGYVFTGVAAGDYTARASLLDVNGGVIGAPITQAFSAALDTRVVQAPASLSITVEPE